MLTPPNCRQVRRYSCNYLVSHHRLHCHCIIGLIILSILCPTIRSLGVNYTRSPESTIAPPRDEVLFECAVNLEAERMEWRFRPLNTRGRQNDYRSLSKSDSTDYNITKDKISSKLRVYVNQDSVGEYRCISWFGASALVSDPAQLTLADIQLNSSNKGSSQPQSLPALHWTVHSGNSFLLKCGDVVSNPQPVWSFYKNNVQISSAVPQLASGTLILQNVGEHDSGEYSCAAVNSITGKEIKIPQHIQLNVTQMRRGPPEFLARPASRFLVKPGTTATLECPGIGNPKPKMVWSRPDASILNDRTSVLGYGLQILNVNVDDHGTYVCRVDNGIVPVLMHTIRLEVQEEPSITYGPEETLTDEGASLTLECRARGFPVPEIYWMINGNDTTSDAATHANGTKLFIRSLEKRHAGIVQCFARNEFGEVSNASLLQVNPKQIFGAAGSGAQPLGTVPQLTKLTTDHNGKTHKGHKKQRQHLMIPPSRPTVTRLNDETVMVRWSLGNKVGLPIQFFKVQYRNLGHVSKKVSRSAWMTSNEDIQPDVQMYEVANLTPDCYYRFRIAAVYSNNDNKLSNVSTKFLLQRGSQLDPIKSHLIAPNLTSVEPISETAVLLHWHFPTRPQTTVDGFYAYYRPASTAGEYSKATVDGMNKRQFKIDNLEPGTAYEFKLQSFTKSAASDFIAIINGKTLKPSTPPPLPPDTSENETDPNKSKSYLPLIAGAAGGGSVLLLAIILICVCIRRKRSAENDDDANENKAHPDHIQAEPNGFPGGNGRVLSSPIHKSSRLNGVAPRMNITSNPLAQDGGDKNRNVMELRFLPSNTLTAPHPPPMTAALQLQQQQQLHLQQQQQQQHHQQQLQQQHLHAQNNNGNHALPPVPHHHSHQHSPAGDAHRRTLDRSHRNIQYTASGAPDMEGIGGIGVGLSSVRRTRRTSGSNPVVPGSPRVVRGVSSELLHHNRSPMPTRAAAMTGKRNRLGSRTENMSSGSLNSIEV